MTCRVNKRREKNKKRGEREEMRRAGGNDGKRG